MKFLDVFNNYKKFFFLGYFIIILSRTIEFISISTNHGIQANMFLSELLGIIFDFIYINSILIILYPLYYLLSKISYKIVNSTFLIFSILFSTAHIFILQYFAHQLSLLDTFICKHSLDEIIFTITTSGADFLKIGIYLIVFITLILFLYKLLSKKQFSKKSNKSFLTIILFSIILCIINFSFVNNKINDFTKNKSLFFYEKSLIYLLNDDINNIEYQIQDAIDYQKLFSDYQYVDTEYPILHRSNFKDSLSSFFYEFDSAPNIVLIIVEGLNDDFIHDYKGIQIMPFLSSFNNNSLYWTNCLSLGERSYAIVPSILGGLPYADKGFTLQKKFPYHLSLVSTLKANNYYTSFFYGQGAWFHSKDVFFKFNHIDLIVDNQKLPEKYEKIIVGDDHFFWGYNDKILFTNSLNVIDTLPKKPRLDIYFTGTTHPPHVISDENFYDEKFDSLMSAIPNPKDKKIFIPLKQYIKTISFLDDALKDFFSAYKEKESYKNTIFIITGDHPMTEIPLTNSIKRYHVPLIIFSEKLKEANKFSNVVSHLDLFETIFPLLEKYNIKKLSYSTSIGSNLFETNKPKRIPIMDTNREIIDYYSNGYFLSDQTLYKVNENFEIQEVNDKYLIKEIQNELDIFKKTNYYVCQNDKILPYSIYFDYMNFPLFFSKIQEEEIFTNNEYIEISPSIEIENRNIIFEFSFDYTSKSDNGVSIVYSLSDKNGKIIYWGNMGLPKSYTSIQQRIYISKQNVSDSVLIFNAYMWNTNKENFSIKNLKAFAY